MQATIRTNLHSFPRPAQSHIAALQRIHAMQLRDTKHVNPVCHTTLLTHGAVTDRAIVFIHGLTSCPAQFADLGNRFYDLGFNVFRPRMPHHGHTNRMTSDLMQLRASELANFADEIIDIAQGLGRQVYVMGLSVGGAVAAWIAQNRNDVERAIIVSPFLWPQALNRRYKPYLKLISRALPNKFMWWDPALKTEREMPSYGYPRYSTRAVAHSLLLAKSVLDGSRHKKPGARHITVVVNEADKVVDNEATQTLVDNWRKTHVENPNRVECFEFEARMRLPHDLIAPEHPQQQIEQVYPVLLRLADRPSN